MSKKDRRKEIEAGLGSEGKLRILRELIKNQDKPLTKYQIEKLTFLKPVDTRKNLKILVKLGWVRELPFQPKKYIINMENEVVSHLADFFYKVRYT